MDFVARFEKNLVYFIKSNKLIKAGEKILIAVSGGKDSMALLYALNKIKKDLSIDIIAVHMDHALRNDSWREKSVIAKFAERLGIKFISERRSVPDFLRSNPGYSTEEAARIVRYRYLMEKLKKLEGDKIALAHHSDDRVENFFLMLFRGAGVHGLTSMKAKNFPFIRPFMFTNKYEITEYIKKNSIPYIEDYTNYRVDFQRNKVRLVLLPFIREKFCQDINRKIIRTVEILESYSEFIENYSKSLFESLRLYQDVKIMVLNCKKLAEEHNVTISEILRIAFREMSGDVRGLNFEKISRVTELIKKGKNFEYDLGNSIKIFKSYNKLFFMKNYDLTLKEFNYKIDTEGIYNIRETGIVLEFKVLDEFDLRSLKQKGKSFEVFDYDKIRCPIFIRNRKAGDKIKPIGFRGHKKVKTILNEMKVPQWLKDKILILQDSSDKIMWIFGFRVSEDFKVTKNTKHFLLLRILRGGIFDDYEFER